LIWVCVKLASKIEKKINLKKNEEEEGKDRRLI
jgi:hypothetical protein